MLFLAPKELTPNQILNLPGMRMCLTAILHESMIHHFPELVQFVLCDAHM
jgi:hypothetical protein